jgi:hypothetical protein
VSKAPLITCTGCGRNRIRHYENLCAACYSRRRRCGDLIPRKRSAHQFPDEVADLLFVGVRGLGPVAEKMGLKPASLERMLIREGYVFVKTNLNAGRLVRRTQSESSAA